MSLWRTGTRGFAWRIGGIVATLLVSALLSLCSVGKAHAQNPYADCNETHGSASLCQYRSEAYEMARANAQYLCEQTGQCVGLEPGIGAVAPGPGSLGGYYASFRYTQGSGSAVANGNIRRYAEECPADAVWDAANFKCVRDLDCSEAPTLGASAILATTAAGKKCALYQNASDSKLCEYETANDGGSGNWEGKQRIVIGTGEQRTLFATSWVPTGNSCSGLTEEKPFNPSKPVCEQVSAAVRNCVMPNGDQCQVAGDVVTCWAPGQTGPRQTSDGSRGADRQQAPTPNTPPPGMENPQPDGPPRQTTINNNTYNTQNYVGTPGAGGNPSQGDVGEGGNDPTAPDGPGQGDEGDGDGDGPGSPGGGLGDLYEGEGKTVSDVVTEYQTRIENAPIRAATTGFLTVSLGGSCPTFSVPATDFWNEMTFAYHCNGALADALSLGGWVILAVAAYAAFRMAFL